MTVCVLQRSVLRDAVRQASYIASVIEVQIGPNYLGINALSSDHVLISESEISLGGTVPEVSIGAYCDTLLSALELMPDGPVEVSSAGVVLEVSGGGFRYRSPLQTCSKLSAPYVRNQGISITVAENVRDSIALLIPRLSSDEVSITLSKGLCEMVAKFGSEVDLMTCILGTQPVAELEASVVVKAQYLDRIISAVPSIDKISLRTGYPVELGYTYRQNGCSITGWAAVAPMIFPEES